MSYEKGGYAEAMIPYAEFIGTKDPFPVMSSTPDRIAALCQGLLSEQMSASPAPGKWSLHQIVAHLADTELMFQVRARMILFEDEPRLAAYDQDRWVSGWQREEEPFGETLDRFRVMRRSTLRLFQNASATDLDRTGIHSERGLQKARDYITIIAGHDINHLTQIESICARFRGGRQGLSG